MLDNIQTTSALLSVARGKARDYDTKSVHPKLVDDYVSKGWTILSAGKTATRLSRPKDLGRCFEDRVWTLLYRMGFEYMSSDGGAKLQINAKNGDGPTSQLDVVAIDNEVAIAVECKASEQLAKRPQFVEELGKFTLIRDPLTKSISLQYKTDFKRQIGLLLFLKNAIVSDNEMARSEQANVVVFDQKDVQYYEQLVSHVGEAAKYQFLADAFKARAIPGLTIRIPAVKNKMGGANCYSFAASPKYLLKIAYVSHRAKGRGSDINAYQRMLNRSRLRNIRKYIDENGIFPTNIVMNIDSNRIQFEKVKQENSDNEFDGGGVLGWLEIRPSYRCAWIIDGQHRLYAYAGVERAAKSRLTVLAFEGLPPSRQAQLFVDINAKQKSVKRSLLQELYSELHWDSDEVEVRLRAVISKAVQVLDGHPESPLFGRIQTSESGRDDLRCITLPSLFGALERSELFIMRERKGSVLEYGPFWGGDNEATLSRTVAILEGWLEGVRRRVPEWWAIGAGAGGGIAMNDGVVSCIETLKSVCSHLDSKGIKLNSLDASEVVEAVREFAEIIGDYLAGLPEDGRRAFRELRGVQGQTTRRRRMEQAISQRRPAFAPVGLAKFLEEERSQTNLKGKQAIDDIEVRLQAYLVDELKREFGEDEKQWWVVGVPKNVRLKVMNRYEEENGARGGREYYFDLVDYRAIITEHWDVFEAALGYGEKGGKEKKTAWLSYVNERRKVVAHPSSGVMLSVDEVAQLEEYRRWFLTQVNVTTPLGAIDKRVETGDV